MVSPFFSSKGEHHGTRNYRLLHQWLHPQPSYCLDTEVELTPTRGHLPAKGLCPLFFKEEAQNETHRQTFAYTGVPLR